MTYRGKVHNGVVVLEPPAKLAEGTEVRVEPVAKAKWTKCVGTLSEDEANGILTAVDELCERVEEETGD